MTKRDLFHSHGVLRKIRCLGFCFTKNSRSFRNRSHSLCFSLLRTGFAIAHTASYTKSAVLDFVSRKTVAHFATALIRYVFRYFGLGSLSLTRRPTQNPQFRMAEKSLVFMTKGTFKMTVFVGFLFVISENLQKKIKPSCLIKLTLLSHVCCFNYS